MCPIKFYEYKINYCMLQYRVPTVILAFKMKPSQDCNRYEIIQNWTFFKVVTEITVLKLKCIWCHKRNRSIQATTFLGMWQKWKYSNWKCLRTLLTMFTQNLVEISNSEYQFLWVYIPYILESNLHLNLINTSFCRFLKRKIVSSRFKSAPFVQPPLAYKADWLNNF